MKKGDLERIFEEAFSFLLTEYNFTSTLSKRESWGYKFTAQNLTTGVRIKYEFREAYIQINLYKLIDGKIIENTADAIKNDDPITGFGLWWIIKLKNPEAALKPAYEYGIESPFYDEKNGLKNYVELFSSRLKEYASDILNGDFSSFSALDTMVKEYYKKNGN